MVVANGDRAGVGAGEVAPPVVGSERITPENIRKFYVQMGNFEAKLHFDAKQSAFGMGNY